MSVGTKRANFGGSESPKGAKSAKKGKLLVRKELKEEPSSDEESASSSEGDDLDDLDGSGDDLEGSEDDLDGSEDDLDGSEDEVENGDPKTEKRDNHTEQRKLIQQRKLQRHHGEKIQAIKSIWEELRVKSGVASKKRKALVEEIWALAEDSIKELVLKHDASRVIQTIFKYADKPKRVQISKALMGSYYEIVKSSYGKYLVVKILHYGSSEIRQSIVTELQGQYRKLIRHREAAYVVEDLYRFYATSAQKSQIIREFYDFTAAAGGAGAAGATKSLLEVITDEPEKRQFLLRNLNETITASVNKGSIGFNIIHAAMLEYVQCLQSAEEKSDFVDLVGEQIAEIVHTAEGSKVASITLAMATAKERKTIIKALKPFVGKLALDDYGHWVLITLFNTVDDTKLVPKSFLPTLDGSVNVDGDKESVVDMVELLQSTSGRKPFLYLLAGRAPRYFVTKKFDQIDQLKKTTSKKDDELRRLELNEAFTPLILTTIETHLDEFLNDQLGAQFISEALLYTHGHDEQCEKVAKAVIDALVLGQVELNQKNSALTRTLRALVQGGHWINTEKKIVASPEPMAQRFRVLLTDELVKNKSVLLDWATGEGSFVVVALLESGSKVKKILLGHKKAIQDAADGGNKGSKLIISLL